MVDKKILDHENSSNNNSWKDISVRCEFVPPDGGWGFAITLSMIVVFCVTVIPMSGFEIVYGPFLQNMGDVTGGTAIVNNLFNTVLYFTGLATNHFLLKYSNRKVGLIGAFIYCLGSVSTIFVTSLLELVLTFSILQGLGFGLMLPSIFTAFNTYFDNKKIVVMNAAQNALGFGPCFVPAILQYLMDRYGFRGTLAILCAISFHTIPAMLCLHPIKWHLKKQYISLHKDSDSEQETIHIEDDRLLDQHESEDYPDKEHLLESPSKSLVSMGSMTMSVASIHQLEKNEDATSNFWKILIKVLNLGLLKNVIYINIAIGLAFSMTSDSTFLTVYPSILTSEGFTTDELSLIMTIYFVSDLVSRSILSLLTPVLTIKNRYQFLTGIALSAVFRTAFIMNYSFWWITVVMTILGFLRCLLHSPFPLVIAEAFPEHFVPAFSIYMLVCGCVSLLFGPLTAIVKATTNSDVMVVHLLTIALMVCAISWSIELFYVRLTKKQNSQVK